MTYRFESRNEYGTPVSAFTCDTCGGDFTVCPAVRVEKRDQWDGCLATECPSYDPDRDVDMLMLLGAEVQAESAKQTAWREMNAILDDGGSDEEYRAAFERWQRLAMGEGDDA